MILQRSLSGQLLLTPRVRDVACEILAGSCSCLTRAAWLLRVPIGGGEITEYTKMMAESREQSLQRMVEAAEKQGANAIVGMKFATSMIMQNAAEILVYGTGVVLE